jgi:H+-translocating NAD(P) transhydrogenase subunit beta
VIRFEFLVIGMVIGAVIGAVLALKIQMTAMPQLVGLLNGFGGGASVLVAGAELIRVMRDAGGEVNRVRDADRHRRVRA